MTCRFSLLDPLIHREPTLSRHTTRNLPCRTMSRSSNSTDVFWEKQEKLREERIALRKLALKRPLYPGLEFHVPLSFPPISQDPSARRMLSFCLEKNRQPTYIIRLLWALQWVPDSFSTVWVADVAGYPDHSDRVIVKVIQPSMFPLTYPLNRPSEALRREIAAYEVLIAKGLGGTAIPYYFGCHEIVTPSEESAHAFVMELIQGEPLYDLGDPDAMVGTPLFDWEPGYKNLVTQAFKSLDAISPFVFHSDLQDNRNALYSQADNHVVIFDFGRSSVLAPDADSDHTRSAADYGAIAGSLKGNKHSTAVQKWVTEKYGVDYR